MTKTNYIKKDNGELAGSYASPTKSKDIPKPQYSGVPSENTADTTVAQPNVDTMLAKTEELKKAKFVERNGEESLWAYRSLQNYKNNDYMFSPEKDEAIATNYIELESMRAEYLGADPYSVSSEGTEITYLMKLTPHPTLENVYVTNQNYYEDDLNTEQKFAILETENGYEKILVKDNEITGSWDTYDAETYITYESSLYQDNAMGVDLVDDTRTSVKKGPSGNFIALQFDLVGENQRD